MNERLKIFKEKSCKNKMVYISYKQAKDSLGRLRRANKGSGSGRIYFCKICGHYHITTRDYKREYDKYGKKDFSKEK